MTPEHLLEIVKSTRDGEYAEMIRQARILRRRLDGVIERSMSDPTGDPEIRLTLALADTFRESFVSYLRSSERVLGMEAMLEVVTAEARAARDTALSTLAADPDRRPGATDREAGP